MWRSIQDRGDVILIVSIPQIEDPLAPRSVPISLARIGPSLGNLADLPEEFVIERGTAMSKTQPPEATHIPTEKEAPAGHSAQGELYRICKEFDPASIMAFPLPSEYTDGRLTIGSNTKLSEKDKAFVASLYPA
jgi:hypothetical protein